MAEIMASVAEAKGRVKSIIGGLMVGFMGLAVMIAVSGAAVGASQYELFLLLMAFITAFSTTMIMVVSTWFVSWWMEVHGEEVEGETITLE